MAQWTRIADSDELPSGGAREFFVAGKLLAVFRVGEEVFALDAICPHQGGPLAKGAVSEGAAGCIVTCPWHGWQFDLKTGQQQIIKTIRQPTYPVKIEGRQIFVDLGEAST